MVDPTRRLRSIRRSRLSRRRALQSLGALVGAATLGCADDGAGDDTDGATSDSDGGSTDTGTGTDTGTDTGDTGTGDTGTDTEDPGFGACDGSELSPEALLANIDHIVVVMMENRSFDHVFGSLSLLEGLPVDGLLGGESNPDLDDVAVPVFNTELWVHPEDPPHSWGASHGQFNLGANDGFVREFQMRGAASYGEVMGYFQRSQLPVVHALADEYVLCDRWFCSVMSSTWPNRFYLHCADSDGMQTNDPISGLPSLFDQLSDAGISNRYYYANLPFVITYGTAANAAHVQPIQQFFADADAGELPSFCIIDPILTAGPTIGNDDHPPADVRDGQGFLATIYEALAASPNWSRSLLVITYDEHGGFFDHVAPPTTVDPHPGFEQLGFRVPALVIGPQVRRGCANATVFDHVAVAATVARRWKLAPLNDRVAASNDLSSCIDPAYIEDPRPPIPLPKLVVPRLPRVHVPGANFGGQLELAALWAKGRRGGDKDWIRASQESMAFLRDRMVRRNLVRLG